MQGNTLSIDDSSRSSLTFKRHNELFPLALSTELIPQTMGFHSNWNWHCTVREEMLSYDIPLEALFYMESHGHTGVSGAHFFISAL